MSGELEILSITALTIGFVHTILGPDHYIPFIAMSKAGKWTLFKTFWVTILSGIGHVLSSIVIGFIGIGLGITLHFLEDIEAFRGELAAWALISFGLIYFIWGVRHAIRNKKHSHWHKHEKGVVHNHTHTHKEAHSHVHGESSKITPWVLFTIFIFGPCEALIPVLMFPASDISISGMVLVVALFGISTIVTMLSIVLLSVYGLNFISFQKYEKYTHAAAGLIIVVSGLAVQFLGL